jgi:hypothetical protein
MAMRFLAAAAMLVIAQSQAQTARVLARLEDRAISESSGIVASRANAGIFWTHNDSGDGPVLYAFDREGHRMGRFNVTGATAHDWEDISVGRGPVAERWYLYVADTGDNPRNRREVMVYRVEEPKPNPECRTGCATAAATAIRLKYPDGPHNAEALLVHPVSGDLYIVSKSGGGDANTTVYVARARDLSAGVTALTALASLDIPERIFRTMVGGITGGDISPDGRRVALCDYIRMYEAALPPGAAFDDIWKQAFTPAKVQLGPQTEAICYTPDGQTLLTTSEGGPCVLTEIVR